MTHTELEALAQEISELEGVGMRTALVLAELAMPDLQAYACDWDQQAQPRCPECHAPLAVHDYDAGGHGYRYMEVCTRDDQHVSQHVA